MPRQSLIQELGFPRRIVQLEILRGVETILLIILGTVMRTATMRSILLGRNKYSNVL
jgi:hypothetical protein